MAADEADLGTSVEGESRTKTFHRDSGTPEPAKPIRVEAEYVTRTTPPADLTMGMPRVCHSRICYGYGYE